MHFAPGQEQVLCSLGRAAMPHGQITTALYAGFSHELPKPYAEAEAQAEAEADPDKAEKPEADSADLMYQGLYEKFGPDHKDWPLEEQHYQGAHLGEYARPPVLGEKTLGGLPQATLPLGASEDELSLISQSASAARRARHAATYTASAAATARLFLHQAQVRARELFGGEAPISVMPTADVFPRYSAASPFAVALLGPPGVFPSNSRRCAARGAAFL
eukprot:gnl/TRDRNA2_/TRDRNA2_33805_c0_seq1.p1 gnl/TRDRNA2_/TRDRNA2_33805_c0~~gnl/TRDRNA2_/TRDRNA2_33805_c0_seq1.p1  ORF type:complete len:218 (+),score=38.31 gnl/TRDRNA2_/TRDRNA2_33805_c0_seq1:9-662(+)